MNGLIQSTYAQTPLDICPEGQFEQVCGASIGPGDLIGQAITLIFIVAIILALVFLIYGGIKWILSGGDKGKVDEARGAIVAAIVGLVLIFLSYFILNFVLGLFGLSINNLSFPQVLITENDDKNQIVITPTPTPETIILVATPTPEPASIEIVN